MRAAIKEDTGFSAAQHFAYLENSYRQWINRTRTKPTQKDDAGTPAYSNEKIQETPLHRDEFS